MPIPFGCDVTAEKGHVSEIACIWDGNLNDESVGSCVLPFGRWGDGVHVRECC
jgi:hypothetical protein